ncbi:MAG: hypothetical protein PWQ67_2040 [Clostridia bacterium]|jgi:uncharacterized membrane protein required for colicin V production|nr:hypothetical protein [Clostridia bacterium]MDN5323586.1 hypothetical protein [Clostridia bacterium]
MNFNFIDFAIIILLILGAFNGYRQGFIGSLVGFLGSIVALLLSIKFYKPFAGLLNEKFGILSSIHGFLSEHLPLPVEVSTAPINQTGLNILIMKVNSMTLPEFIKQQVIEQAQNLAHTAGQFGIANAGELLTYIVAITLLNGLALLLLWFLIDKILFIVAKILSRSLDNTFLGGVNRIAGLVMGIAINALGLIVFVGILTLFLEVTGQARSSMLVALAKTANQSVLVPYFKQGYNIILSKVISFI